MKALPPRAGRLLARQLGRAFLTLGTLVLVAAAWRGWSSADAQGVLESLWSLCSVR